MLNNRLLLLLSLFVFGQCFTSLAPCAADVSSALTDTYLSTQFSWVLFVDCQKADHYLSYPGSELTLTKVRVGMRPAQFAAIKPYQEFWYHQGTPIGTRRLGSLDTASGQLFGAIVVKPTVNGSNYGAITNTVMRLIMDLHFKKLSAMILVPESSYDQIAGELGRYNFHPVANLESLQGPQKEIRLRSYPFVRTMDQTLYFQH